MQVLRGTSFEVGMLYSKICKLKVQLFNKTEVNYKKGKKEKRRYLKNQEILEFSH